MLLVEVFCLCYKGGETNEAVAVFLTAYAVGTAKAKAKSFMHAMQHAVSLATKLPKSSSSSSANVSSSYGFCLHNAGAAVIADSCERLPAASERLSKVQGEALMPSHLPKQHCCPPGHKDVEQALHLQHGLQKHGSVLMVGRLVLKWWVAMPVVACHDLSLQLLRRACQVAANMATAH